MVGENFRNIIILNVNFNDQFKEKKSLLFHEVMFV